MYGAASGGGSGGAGTIFAINTNGTGFTTLHSFAPGGYAGEYRTVYTNSDGASPWGALILASNTLYGTTHGGGTAGKGTVFRLNTDGTGFANLHTFGGTRCIGCGDLDGGEPVGGLTLLGDTLYGSAVDGRFGQGTLFAIKLDGTGFSVLHTFTGSTDGSSPGTLILSGNTLYWVNAPGGSSGSGTLFAINTDGTGFTLYSLAGDTDGASPSSLLLFGNTLYGTAYSGGSSGTGTIFSLSIPPRLTITQIGASAVLTWPSNATGYVLQSTLGLSSPVWTAVSPAPVVVNGQNTVTNLISGAQQFFRLSQ
jgi:uncharacterized repeat protein (TIGR03803 family)